jgi:putative MFS transporter
MIWAVWFGWSFSYFGILLWLPTLLTKYKGLSGSEVFPFMIGFMISGIAGRIVVSSVIDRIGRVPMIAVFGLFGGGLFLTFGYQTPGPWLYIVGYAFAFFHDGGLSAIASYTPELYPTSLRATGYGFSAGVGRLASIISPALTGFLVDESVILVFAILACGYVLAALSVGIFGPETKSHVLDEQSP